MGMIRTLRKLSPLLLLWPLSSTVRGAEAWEGVLQQALNSEYSQTRRDGLKQVDTRSAKGLKALWGVLSINNPDQVDWYVREGAYEALSAAEGEEAEKEITRLLKAPGNDLAKEAIVYSVIWKIRTEFVKDFGGSNDRKIEEAKHRLRKSRGVDYFALVLPTLRKLDPEEKRLGWIRLAFADKQSRVRRAAITGFLAYPHKSSVPLLLENLKRLEKKKSASYQEWVLTRNGLEVLTGQYFRENVEDWQHWWEISEKGFSIEKRVEEEAGKKDSPAPGKTTVVKQGGVEVSLKMKVAGEKAGYPLLVLPWEEYEPDYFRPYFNGVEEFMRVYYVEMPSIDDFKGLARDEKTNLVKYPTEILARALADLMKDTNLQRYAVLGHGPWSSISAMKLAALYPKQVTHLVLINPMSAGSEYSQAIANVRQEGTRRKNREIVKGADSITLEQDNKHKYTAADAAEAGGLGRALGNLHYADPTMPEVGMINFLYQLPGGTGTLNDDSWSIRKIFEGKKPTLAVMVAMGEKDPWTPVGDMMRVAGFFDRTYLAKFPSSAETPFISETYSFTQHMEKFFAGVRDKSKPAKKSAKTAP